VVGAGAGSEIGGGFRGEVEDAQVDLVCVIQASEQPAREALTFEDDGVADLEPPAAVELHLVEVVVEFAQEQGASLGVEPEAAFLLIEQLRFYSPRGEQVDDDALAVDPEKLDQVVDE